LKDEMALTEHTEGTGLLKDEMALTERTPDEHPEGTRFNGAGRGRRDY